MLNISETELQEIMCKYDEAMRQDAIEQAEGLAQALAVVKSLVGPRKLQHIEEYIADSGVTRDFEITETHGGYKEVCGGYAFRYVYLIQRTGHFCDEHDGEIWIPLPKGKFLKFHFAC